MKYSEPFCEPFCTIRSKGSFRGARYNYLPPLEPEEKVEEEKIYMDMRWTARQWDAVQQLQGKTKFLERKVNELYKKKQGVHY